MITELKSIPDIWKWMPSEMYAQRFLEDIIWSAGRHRPHCGSVDFSLLRGKSCRRGLYQCRDCRLQFTVTTNTPMHGTKLDLRIWICAIFLVLTSSKGIPSVVMAQLLGVNQKTAWKMGHAIREMMDDRHGELLQLEDNLGLELSCIALLFCHLFFGHSSTSQSLSTGPKFCDHLCGARSPLPRSGRRLMPASTKENRRPLRRRNGAVEARRHYVIDALERPRTQAELRDALGMSNSGILHLLRYLEQDGLVRPAERVCCTRIWERAKDRG